ncbi:hypothetical protein [Hymenobacter radiodurans]|uniref:hypothetical protein n=1 Tax=Hymenobacter radiodurans TaxID=2496028 RepID=UPI001058E9A0|nr:hypothetical protein [Hymenobacter radiodurans]
METQTIVECTWTWEWLLAGYDEAILEEIKDKRVTCAGTTLGPTAQVMRYLRTILAAIATTKDAVNCVDQAIHNFLFYQGALEPTIQLDNQQGIIMTVGTADPSPYIYDKRGYLLRRDGQPVLTIHQADRHPQMLQELDKFIFKPTVAQTISKPFNVGFAFVVDMARLLRRTLRQI